MTVIMKGSKQANPPLQLELVEKDGEVRLRSNGHDFVRVYTDEFGAHRVQVIDVDTGPVSSPTPSNKEGHDVQSLCWRR